MDAVNVLVLPALAVIVLVACGMMAWFIFRTPTVEKARETDAERPRTRDATKKAL